MNHYLFTLHWGSKDFNRVSEDQDEEEQKRKQTEEQSDIESEQSCKQKNEEVILSQNKRIFSISKSSIL